MQSVLMVCLGNICRSPLAEGLLKSKINTKDIFVDSAGTGSYHLGSLPDKRSIDVATKNLIDITDQRCRQFQVSDFDTFDLIYVMDNLNRRDLELLARNDQDKAKIKMILNEIFPNENVDVPDPYLGGEKGFEEVFDMLNKACAILASKLNS